MADPPGGGQFYEPAPVGAEADDAGCEAVPADLVELHEALEWEAAVRARAAEALD